MRQPSREPFGISVLIHSIMKLASAARVASLGAIMRFSLSIVRAVRCQAQSAGPSMRRMYTVPLECASLGHLTSRQHMPMRAI